MNTPPSATNGHSAAVVVAHPGHEVRLHGWLERERPQVFVLTDGSGRAGTPRIASTSRYLRKFGLRPAPVYGRLTDLEVYAALLARDHGLFLSLCEELADAFVAGGVTCVVADASEGYNTAHDVCRLLADAAVELARRASGREVKSYDYPVVRRPDHCPAPRLAGAVWLHLDEETFGRKLSAAFEFYPELAAETRRDFEKGRDRDDRSERFKLEGDEHAATGLSGLDVFRVECLRPVSAADPPFDEDVPFYERHGERRVAEGLYGRVIRYREHLAPLADALRGQVERRA